MGTAYQNRTTLTSTTKQQQQQKRQQQQQQKPQHQQQQQQQPPFLPSLTLSSMRCLYFFLRKTSWSMDSSFRALMTLRWCADPDAIFDLFRGWKMTSRAFICLLFCFWFHLSFTSVLLLENWKAFFSPRVSRVFQIVHFEVTVYLPENLSPKSEEN